MIQIITGLWDEIINQQMKGFYPPWVSRPFKWLWENVKGPLLVLELKWYFFFYIGTEEGVRRLIDQQLDRAKDPRAKYFREVFTPFAQTAYRCFTDQPLIHSNIDRFVKIYLNHLEYAWRTQSSATFNLQKVRDEKDAQRDQEIVENNKKKKAEARKRAKEGEVLSLAEEYQDGLGDEDLGGFIIST